MIKRNYFKVVRVFPDPSDYFYIKNEGYDTGVLTLGGVDTQTRTDLEYKIDNGSWTNFVQTWGGYDARLELQPNSKIYLRGTAGYWKDSDGNGPYIMVDEISAVSIGGDLRTLLYYTDVDSVTTIPANCFNQTFQEKKLTSIENLTLGSSVTTVGDYAFHQMFYFNPDITTGLDLSGVTTLGNYPMDYMYYGCSSLNEVYAPNVSTWERSKAGSWLGNVASTGVLYKPANLVIDTDSDSGVPSGWTTQTYPQA